jgi:hypothetical protein
MAHEELLDNIFKQKEQTRPLEIAFNTTKASDKRVHASTEKDLHKH